MYITSNKEHTRDHSMAHITGCVTNDSVKKSIKTILIMHIHRLAMNVIAVMFIGFQVGESQGSFHEFLYIMIFI